MVTRGTQLFGMSGSVPRTCRKPAFRNIASFPKNTKSSCRRELSARGYASTAGAPNFAA